MTTVIFDMETGGVEPHHPNISLAAVVMRDGAEIDSMNCLIQFNEADAQPEALEINHYDAARWAAEAIPEQAATLRFSALLNRYKVLPLLSARTGNYYNVAWLAGYNSASFDGPRLGAMYDKYKLFPPYRRPTLDILQLAIDHCEENQVKLANFKLSTVAAYFGISTEDAHDALADCRMTAAIHKALRPHRGLA